MLTKRRKIVKRSGKIVENLEENVENWKRLEKIGKKWKIEKMWENCGKLGKIVEN